MRHIDKEAFTETVAALCIKACTRLPEDVYDALLAAREREAEGSLARCVLEELADCLPAPASHSPEGALEAEELRRALDGWLAGLPKGDRVLFLRRYWYGLPLQTLAAGEGASPAKLAQRMLRLRRSLQKALEKEGISL